MADKIDSKKEHLEGILGEKISPEALALFPVFLDVAISTETPCTITQQSLIIARPNRCFESQAFDVSGCTHTRDNGQVVFRLSNFRCPKGEIYSAPINVLATPVSPKPVFLTVMQALVNNGTDVEITVFSWDANGAAAPNIAFNWRCRVEHLNIIL